jgi:DNA-binding response OmpR family regulator
MRVLLIDDNENIVEAFKDYYEAEGIDCKAVTNGINGLEEIQKEKYDLVLLDIAIPELNGMDVLKQLDLKSVDEKNIIVITASVLQHDEIKYLKELGVKEILYKPISLEKIEDIKKKYLTK